jgi:ABC-2 type transport system permease protein
MLIVSLLSWLIHQWSSRFVNKNIMQIVFMIMFLLGYLTISLGSFSEDLVAVFDPFIQLINAFYEPALWFQQGVATLDFLSIVLFLAFHGLAYGVFILVMTPLSRVSNLDQLSARQSSQATSNTRYRKQSFFWSMVHKEWRYYFSIPIYFINTAFGLLLMLGGSIGLALFRNEVLMVLELPDLPIEWVVLIFFGLSISTVYTPAISLSLEGSNFSVLKSLPINGKTVMLSKVVFNIVLILIPLLMAWFILSMTNIMSLVSLSFIGFNAVLFTVLMSLINGLINLAFPKFEFQNEVEVVKQSLGALLGVFSGFGVMVLFALFLSVFVVLDFVFMMIALSLIQILFVVFLLWVYERFVHGWFQTL